MELSYFKKLWLKLIACICSTQNNEIPKEITNSSVQTSTVEEQNQNTHEDVLSENDSKRMFSGALSSKEQGLLFTGIEKSNHVVMQKAINQGANVNTAINGLDPLQYAIRNGTEYIIEFLIQAGAEVKEHHLQLAESQQLIYITNLTEKDMVFHGAQDSRLIILQKIRQYQSIANILKEEMEYQEKKKASQAKLQHSKTATAAQAAAQNATNNTAPNNQPSALSTRPKVVTFAIPPSNHSNPVQKKPTKNNDDDDDGL